MSGSRPVLSLLVCRNRQKTRSVRTGLLRRITRHLLEEELRVESYELCLHLVDAPEITRLNEHFLRHAGPTDVIAFDHAVSTPDLLVPRRLHGELFICLPVAVEQARKFRATWPAEVARYVVHGLLHLCGYDDQEPAARRVMKRQENRLLRRLAAHFRFADLARPRSAKPALR